MELSSGGNMKRIALFQLLVVVAFLVGCSYDERTEPNREMSILAFIVADNDLDDHALYVEKDIIKGLKSCPSGTEVLIYMDRLNELPTLKKYTLTNEGKIGINNIESYTEQCSTSPQVFRDVLAEMRNNSSGKRYGLIYWSHGNGWLPATGYSNASTRAIGMDQGVSMSISDMADGILANDPAAFLVMDACYMGCAPVAYELRDATEYLISSPTNMPGIGFNYNKMLPYLLECTEQSLSCSLDLFKESNETNIYGDSASFAIASVVKCGEMENLANCMREVVKGGKEFVDEDLIQSFDFDQVHMYYDLENYASELSLDPESLGLFREQMNSTIIKTVSTAKIWSQDQSGLISKVVSRFCGLSTYILGAGNPYYDWEFSRTKWYNKVYEQDENN